jgi:hypothetical protein
MKIKLMKLATLIAAVFLSFVLSACTTDEKVGVSYDAYNHTDQNIVSIVINGDGGILDAMAHGGGGTTICCVILPKRWRPGLMATIKWQLGGKWLKDEQGKEVIRDGVKVLVPGPWKEKTVEVPKYDSTNGMGMFFIHFFPDDEVKVLVNLYGAGHPSHPYPDPDDDRPQTR